MKNHPVPGIAALLLLPCLVLPAPAATLSVPSSYPTIQAAVDAAASHGDVIEVDAGEYPEDVTVSAKDVSIVGLGGSGATTVRSFRWINPITGTEYESDLNGFRVQGDVSVAVAHRFVTRWCELHGNVSMTTYGTSCSLYMQDCTCLGDASLADGGSGAVADFERCTFVDADATIATNGLGTVRDCRFVRGAIHQTGSSDDVEILENELSGPGAAIDAGVAYPAALHIWGNTLTNADGGIRATAGYPYGVSVRNNKLFWCAGGITAFGSGVDIDVEGNQLVGCAEGISTDNNDFVVCKDNSLISCGSGLTLGGYFYVATVEGNSVSQCTGDGLRIAPLYSGVYDLQLSHNVVAGCGSGVHFVTLVLPPSTIGCNDVWNNAGGNWLGIADPSGTDGNFSADPLFCVPGSDLRLAQASPCLPGNHPDGWDCGTIGAFGQGCLEPGGESAGIGMDGPGNPLPDGSAADPVIQLSLPNPYRPGAAILLGSRGDAREVELLVFDITGACVRHLWSGPMEGGTRVFSWNGRCDSGAKAHSGRYLLVANGGSARAVRSVVLFP